MATETATLEGESTSDRLVNTVVAGVVAGLVFGVMIQFVLERMTAIGALYTLGDPSLSVGWVAHIVHSVVFALVYAQVTRLGPLPEYADGPVTGAATGAAFGFLLWFVNIGFVWPVWLNAVGFAGLPVPYHAEAVQPLVGHLVWGVLLGSILPLVSGLRA